MNRGPMELVVAEFPGDVPGARLAAELADLVKAGVIRIVDLTFVTKEPDGTIASFELRDREGHEGYEALDTIVDTLEGLISDEDLEEIAADVSAGKTAVALLFEHVWARQLRTLTLDSGGEVVFTERIPAGVVDQIVAAAA